MRTATRVFVLALLAAPALASASCYSVFTSQNRLVYQSTATPIDLSRRISDAMRERFPGGYFVMVPGDVDCPEVRAGGATTRPRLDAVGRVPGAEVSPDQLIEASPLFREVPTSAGSDAALRGSGRGRVGGYTGGR